MIINAFGCVVCGVQMPGTTSLELLKKLCANGYSPTMIFITGYFPGNIVREAVAPTLFCDWLSGTLSSGE